MSRKAEGTEFPAPGVPVDLKCKQKQQRGEQ